MKILNAGCPRADGFYMPAEYAPHNGTIIIWPKRPGSWIYGAGRAREAFAEVICAIAESEQAYVLAEADVIDKMRRAMSEESTGALMPGAARWMACTQTGQRMTE